MSLSLLFNFVCKLKKPFDGKGAQPGTRKEEGAEENWLKNTCQSKDKIPAHGQVPQPTP